MVIIPINPPAAYCGVKLQKSNMESNMPTLIHQRVKAAQEGTNKYVICKMPSGWAVFGDQQFISGYSLLLSDPVVVDLNALSGKNRTQFLSDMALVGDALLEATDAFRINYEILGNDEPALHAHIFPRYKNEPKQWRRYPVWMAYTKDERHSRPFDMDRDKELMERIARILRKRL
jgi:diadenosine tetraphosphate (Ap4A) HIT family hydrolase